MNPFDAVIDVCRAYPEQSRVRYRINDGGWQMASGKDFLVLWDQPIAGTIDVDNVIVPRDDAPSTA